VSSGRSATSGASPVMPLPIGCALEGLDASVDEHQDDGEATLVSRRAARFVVLADTNSTFSVYRDR